MCNCAARLPARDNGPNLPMMRGGKSLRKFHLERRFPLEILLSVESRFDLSPCRFLRVNVGTRVKSFRGDAIDEIIVVTKERHELLETNINSLSSDDPFSLGD